MSDAWNVATATDISDARNVAIASFRASNVSVFNASSVAIASDASYVAYASDASNVARAGSGVAVGSAEFVHTIATMPLSALMAIMAVRM